ncbi:hypothetical protein [Halobacteriovorax sp. RZ-2]|uniref:hypothetical protein n=1 Tax=unclassified Halobacteriovorax TaxID=2639665 RepID=UPI003710E899
MSVGEGRKEESLGVSAKTVQIKKRGRKPKNVKIKFQINPEQTKFFVDLSKDKESLSKVMELLVASNNKDYGKEITFKDLSLFGIEKISPKDIEKIQELSLSKRELLERAWEDFNKKNKQSLSFDDFLLKKLGLN